MGAWECDLNDRHRIPDSGLTRAAAKLTLRTTPTGREDPSFGNIEASSNKRDDRPSFDGSRRFYRAPAHCDSCAQWSQVALTVVGVLTCYDANNASIRVVVHATDNSPTRRWIVEKTMLSHLTSYLSPFGRVSETNGNLFWRANCSHLSLSRKYDARAVMNALGMRLSFESRASE